MKRILLTATALAALAAAPAAFAQNFSGTVNLTGTVAAKCSMNAGNATTTIDPTTAAVAVGAGGELSQTSGVLKTGLSVPVQNYTVACSGANNTVTLTATPMTTAAAAPTGYANKINYIATAAVDQITNAGVTGTLPLSHDLTAGTPAANATGTVSNRLRNVANNVRISAGTFATPAASDLLVNGTYTGSITLTVTAGS